MNPNYNKIVSMATDRDYVAMRNLYSQLLGERMRMDKFFSMYLDKFERKMDPEKTNTPIWDLYKKKLKEYGDLQQTIKVAEYYMKKA
jgi:hypothetical protein